MRAAVGVLAALVIVACAQEGPMARNAAPSYAPPRNNMEPSTRPDTLARPNPYEAADHQASRPRDASPSAPASTLPQPPAGPQSLPSGETLFYNSGSSQTDLRVRTVSKAEAQKLIKMLYPKHLSKQSQCPANISGLKQARTHGYIVPQVLSEADGSFTAAGVKEQLYLVSVGECGATHADNFGSDELVVLRNGKVVDRISESGGSSIDHVVDFDGDGRDELIFGSGYWAVGGDILGWAALVRVGRGALKTIKGFGQYENNCGGMDEPRQVKYSLIWVMHTPEGAPRFRVEKKVRPCK